MMMEARQPPPTSQAETLEQEIPSDAQLVLLSLDYLRDLRRAYADPKDLLEAEGLNADWLTLAIYALNRSFSQPAALSHGSDAWMESSLTRCDIGSLPSLGEMTQEVVFRENPNPENQNEDKAFDQDLDSFAWYEYDDSHPSNAHRFYLLNGLASGNRGHLLLGEIAAAGLAQLQARSRHDAEQEMAGSPLFEQFVEAVKSKGFFKDSDNDTPNPDPVEEEERLQRQRLVYQERHAKVVAKFRTKLALKADPGVVSSLSDQHHARRVRRCLAVRKDRNRGHLSPPYNLMKRLAPGASKPADLEESERLKNVGNAHMQKKEYEAAAATYTKALRLSPSGPNSHVYYSNRAAALLSMKQFKDAISDSERSLSLKPNYGKAHARLGLAHFLLGDYRQAMEAYTVALKYEPDNKSSKSYLEKAAKRLAAQGESSVVPGSSFSVVSEWDKSTKRSVAGGQEQHEAEKLKVKGNQHMANREYQLALDAYSQAIHICSNGQQSHVYYSNRAAALCYLEKYHEAAQDSEASLKLKPSYGKAHARLGLSRFFLNDYLGAVAAYTAALEYDPDNAASTSYLAKAKLKLEQHSPHVEPSVEARRLMDDPDMLLMAKKALHNPNATLMEDPEMQSFARKAMSDPTMMAALQHVNK